MSGVGNSSSDSVMRNLAANTASGRVNQQRLLEKYQDKDGALGYKNH